MTTEKTTAVKTARVTRRPLHQRGPQAIQDGKDPNYEYRFVNDIGSRIDVFKQAGYEIVTDTELSVGDSRVSDASKLGSGKTVISKDGTTSYLMRIKKEWYDEDQAAKISKLAEQDEAMIAKASQEMSYGKIEISRK